jgi:hypothetical protein
MYREFLGPSASDGYHGQQNYSSAQTDNETFDPEIPAWTRLRSGSFASITESLSL